MANDTKAPTVAELWQQCQQEAAAMLTGANEQTPAVVLARPAFTAQQRQVEALGDEAIAKAGLAIDPAKIRSAVLGARDPADLADRLAVLIGDLEQSKFAAVFEQALFAAEVVGFIHAHDDAKGG